MNYEQGLLRTCPTCNVASSPSALFIKTDSGRGEVGGGRASRTGEGDGGALARNWAKMGWMRGHTERKG